MIAAPVIGGGVFAGVWGAIGAGLIALGVIYLWFLLFEPFRMLRAIKRIEATHDTIDRIHHLQTTGKDMTYTFWKGLGDALNYRGPEPEVLIVWADSCRLLFRDIGKTALASSVPSAQMLREPDVEKRSRDVAHLNQHLQHVYTLHLAQLQIDAKEYQTH